MTTYTKYCKGCGARTFGEGWSGGRCDICWESRRDTIINALKMAGGTLAIIATVDAFGFIAWVASGQVPSDSFYIGTLTAHVLRALIS